MDRENGQLFFDFYDEQMPLSKKGLLKNKLEKIVAFLQREKKARRETLMTLVNVSDFELEKILTMGKDLPFGEDERIDNFIYWMK